MSLASIISQLQSVQPYRRGMTAESIALDLTKTKNSLLRMARLLQNSGRAQGNQYIPDVSSTSRRSDNLTKELRKTTSNLSALSGDQKRFKGFVQQSIKNVDRQLKSFQQLTRRNESLIKSVQSEIGLGRPQRIMNYEFGASAAQIPSYGRNIRAQLNRLSQQIAVLNSNQQRMIQQTERAAGDEQDNRRISSVTLMRRRLARMTQGERERIAGTQLPGLATDKDKNAFLVGMLALMATTEAGRKFRDMMKSVFGYNADPEALLEEVKKVPGGTPFKVEGFGETPKIQKGKQESRDVKKLRKELEKLQKEVADEKIDATKKNELTAQIERLKKEKLEKLKKEGFITQEHVAGGLAETKDITHYTLLRTPTSDPEYIEKAIVEKYPEIYKINPNGTLSLIPDWEKTIKGDKVTVVREPPKQTDLGTPEPSSSVIEQVKSDKAFMEKLQQVSEKYEIDPADLLAVMYRETAFTLNPAIQNTKHPNKNSADVTVEYGPKKGQVMRVPAGQYATGLLQFYPTTAARFGYTPDDIKKMSRAQQMDLIDLYFQDVKLPKKADAATIYAYTYLPARAQKGSVLATAGEPGPDYYNLNKSLDVAEPFGQITIEDLKVLTEDAKQVVAPILSQETEQPPERTETVSLIQTIKQELNIKGLINEKIEENNSDMTMLAAAENEQTNEVAQGAYGLALGVNSKVDVLKEAVVNVKKEVIHVKEMVRVATGVTDLHVRDSTVKDTWNMA